ncbi:exodeoxyribonuclease VII small subunit [Citricoccus sp. SGAir0253]|uniref:exodeoxyribonuclease VII small subunit n=1 Tax=Citricoccus sp. SGAir0253 TaxID=2567881 RepID=UPI0010CD4C1D|nr:exodeoxyribonuclease VII small subunit [Citricoccus sp. SGAir0253]QCU77624.1 exodeoxyribonuclease VII small subunit [Citricoccus sp. SGAir0253]
MSSAQTEDAGRDAADRPGGQAAVEGFSAADTSDVAAMSYEQARAELVETVSRLETGGAGLEESLALWERGEALADRCEAWLEGARQRLQQVRERTADGAGPVG